MARDIYMANKRYKAALVRIRTQIENGSELVAKESAEMGDKYTHCSWGLCSGSPEQWPDKEDRLFDHPLTTLYQKKGQNCPFDEKPDREFGPSGCFHSCRIFQNLGNPPTREEAIKRYLITESKCPDTNSQS